MKTFAIRLHPGQDLKAEVLSFCKSQGLQAACVLTCVGSLTKTALRLAGKDQIKVWEEKMEILSLVGTIAADGAHLHLSIADANGQAFGGHLVEGCLIYTTAEIVLGELEDLKFLRVVDPATGYKELEVGKRGEQ